MSTKRYPEEFKKLKDEIDLVDLGNSEEGIIFFHP